MDEEDGADDEDEVEADVVVKSTGMVSSTENGKSASIELTEEMMAGSFQYAEMEQAEPLMVVAVDVSIPSQAVVVLHLEVQL